MQLPFRAEAPENQERGPKSPPRQGDGEGGFKLGFPLCPALLCWLENLADRSDVATPQHTC